jgi:4-azaleucine resistance transporter AzlC
LKYPGLKARVSPCMMYAFKTSLPALFCYVPIGLVYGVVCTQQGLPWYYAPLFSTFVLAGAMQFLALSILAAGGSVAAVALAIIPLGIRNIFYGLAMVKRYRSFHPFLRLYLAHGLVDATYSLLNTGRPEEQEKRYITALTALIHAYWVIGSLMGSFLIHFVTLPKGLEFSLTTFFAATAVEQFLTKKEIKPLLIALSSMMIAWLIFPHHFFLGGIGISILTSLALPYKERRAA